MNAGMQCRVATSFSTVVSRSDFAAFSSHYFQREVGSFQTKLSVVINGSCDSKLEINFCRNHMVDLHACTQAKGIYTVVIVSECTGYYIKLNDCDKHVQTDNK